MSSVPRSVSSSLKSPRSLFKRPANAGVPASGVTASEFVGRCERTSSSTSPRIRISGVPLRSVAYVYGISPKKALRRAFLKIKRAATAAKFRRMAERLAKIASQGPGSARPAYQKSNLRQQTGIEPKVVNRRFQ